MNHVSLFSGYGGLDLGLKMAIPNLRTVLYCEYDRYAQGVLISRMRDGGLDPAPIWTDVRTLDGRCWSGCVDIISGGFPCQDNSRANPNRKGLAGERSGLWTAMLRLICEIRPGFVFVENVAGAVDTGALATIITDLRLADYLGCAEIVSGEEVGFPFENKHLFILAENMRERGEGFFKKEICWESTLSRFKDVRGAADLRNRPDVPEPLICRMGDGEQFGRDRLRLCGNSVPSEQAALAFQILSERITQ